MAKRTATKTREVSAATVRGPGPIEAWLKDMLGDHGESEIGVPVTASSVRGLPAAWYAINKISGHVGSLPINLYNRESEDNARIAREHPAHRLVSRRPNELSTACVWRETMQHHALLYGDGRSAILRNGRGEPSELVLLQPRQWAIVVTAPRDVGGVYVPAKKWHVSVTDPSIKIADADVLHIMSLSDDAMGGIAFIDAARQALGIAIQQQRRAVISEKNGARVRFFLKAPPGVFKKEAEAKEFIDRFNDQHSGDESDRVGLLREGIEAQAISQTNQESQALESRRFSRQDIGLLLGVEQMLGDDASVSYNSLEQKNQAYITNCLMRWLVRWQEECRAKLLTTAERDSDKWYFKFVTAALLQGTAKERYEVYQIGRQIEVLSANDVRELEDMNRRDDGGGDTYSNPATSSPKKAATSNAAQLNNSEPTPVAAKLRKVVASHVRGLVNTERSRIERAASNEKDFAGWVDEFYASWTPRVATTIADCDGDASLAASWVEQSKQRLLAIDGRVGDGGFTEAVRSEVALWDQRAEQLASAILS